MRQRDLPITSERHSRLFTTSQVVMKGTLESKFWTLGQNTKVPTSRCRQWSFTTPSHDMWRLWKLLNEFGASPWFDILRDPPGLVVCRCQCISCRTATIDINQNKVWSYRNGRVKSVSGWEKKTQMDVTQRRRNYFIKTLEAKNWSEAKYFFKNVQFCKGHSAIKWSRPLHHHHRYHHTRRQSDITRTPPSSLLRMCPFLSTCARSARLGDMVDLGCSSSRNWAEINDEVNIFILSAFRLH